MEPIIFNINPWRKTHQVQKIRLCSIKRTVFTEITDQLITTNKTLCLYGPRRAGKTTLLYETIHFLITKKVPAKACLAE